MRILQTADVFVTSVRIDGLRKLGLTFEQLSPLMPKLIYAHMSAWGTTGPDFDQPGFDVGAFWTATGISPMFNDAPRFAIYPPGFGDLTSGQALLSGIVLALRHRMLTGKGQLVDVSLLRVGAFTAAPVVVDSRDVSERVIPCYTRPADKPSPLNDFYLSKEGRSFCLLVAESVGTCGVLVDVGTSVFLCMLRSFCLLVTEGVVEVMMQRVLDIFGSDTKGGLAASFGATGIAEIVAKLERADVPYSLVNTPREALWTEDQSVLPDLFHVKQPFTLIDRIVKLPYEFVGLPTGPLRAAPEKGAHTDHFLRNGWSPRDEPTTQALEGAMHSKEPNVKAPLLQGIVVIELGSGGSAIAGAGRMLADFGATVHRLGCDSDASLHAERPKLFEQLHRAKRALEPSMLPQLVETADLIITDLTHAALSRLSVDAEGARRRSERLVYVQLVPRTGLATEDALASELGPLYSECGMASIFANGGQGLCSTPTPPNRPPQFVLGLMAAQYVLSSSTIGLFHATRTGKGAHVVVSALRIGYWKMQYVHSLGQYNPAFLAHEPAIDLTEAHLLTPLCTFNCYSTKDGMFVQLLCLDIVRFFFPLMSALGLSASVWPGLVLKLGRSLLLSPKGTPVVLKMMPGFIHLNSSVQAAIGKLTFQELQALFKEKGIWFTRVRMPHQLLRYEQAHLSGVFCSNGEDRSKFTLVNTPIQLSSHHHA